jgi:Bacteriocin-protection, YdeI or OmpD-Associated
MALSLAEKLRIRSGSRIAVVNAPESEVELIRALPKDVSVLDDLQGKFDQVHLFVRNRAELSRLASRAVSSLGPAGLLWVYFPKKSSEAQTDLTRDRGWDALKATGVSGVSLISLDEIWAAFAFRRRPPRRRKKAHASNSPNTRESPGDIDRENRVVKNPADLQRALNKNAKAAAAFKALSFTHRKEYLRWILEAKKVETRAKRVAGTVARLAKGLKSP